MSVSIRRDQVTTCIEDAGWKFKDQTTRVLMYRKTGCAKRVFIPKRDVFPEAEVRIILSQAQFTRQAIHEFLKNAVK